MCVCTILHNADPEFPCIYKKSTMYLVQLNKIKFPALCGTPLSIYSLQFFLCQGKSKPNIKLTKSILHGCFGNTTLKKEYRNKKKILNIINNKIGVKTQYLDLSLKISITPVLSIKMSTTVSFSENAV